MENNAMAIVRKQQEDGNLVYVRPEDLATARMFVPQVTVIPCGPHDFHEKPIQGKYMPKAHHVDRIGEAAGIEFVAAHCGTRMEGESTYVGFAQGRRRMPDGSWRASSKQEYEFDVQNRAEEDFLKDTKNQYATELAKRKHILELRKVGRQRASTGARLRVIRELVGIPIAFGQEDFKRALVVSRIAINTDAMLEEPSTRDAAIGMALGAAGDIYGPRPEQIEAPEAFALEPDAKVVRVSEREAIDITDAEEVPIEGGFNEAGEAAGPEDLDHQLEEFLLDEEVGAGQGRVEKIRAALKSANIEQKSAIIATCIEWKARQRKLKGAV